MPTGWICLHRKLQQSIVWNLEPFSRGQAWVDLLLSANHDRAVFMFRGIPVTVQRGQVGLSEETLAAKWKWSRGKVRRFLTWLESERQVIQQKSNVCSLLTILNYDQYQSSDTADDTASDTADGHQTEQQTDTNNNGEQELNNGNNGNKGVGRKRKPRRIPLCAETILDGLVIPDALATENGKLAARQWLEHKDRIGNQYASRESFQIELQRWAPIGPARFAAAVRYSIGRDWKGIFEDKNQPAETLPLFDKPVSRVATKEDSLTWSPHGE